MRIVHEPVRQAGPVWEVGREEGGGKEEGGGREGGRDGRRVLTATFALSRRSGGIRST